MTFTLKQNWNFVITMKLQTKLQYISYECNTQYIYKSICIYMLLAKLCKHHKRIYTWSKKNDKSRPSDKQRSLKECSSIYNVIQLVMICSCASCHHTSICNAFKVTCCFRTISTHMLTRDNDVLLLHWQISFYLKQNCLQQITNEKEGMHCKL